ncbi:ROK family protein [Haloferula sp.]|uniref:ROK family protein n=1 Tax=Haloferula sp. TaxID=2497595 RepID=UPI003C73F2B7
MSDTFYLGIDSGATTSKIAAVRADGSIFPSDLLQRPTGSEGGPEGVIKAWMGAIADYMAEHGMDWDQISGVGLAVPGPRRSYGVLATGPNLPESFDGWDVQHDLLEALREAAGRPLSLALGNDGNMGGVAEAHSAIGNDKAGVVMLAPGSGLGGAYIDPTGMCLDGDTLAGMEISHMAAPLHLLNVEALTCGCGRTWGCFEMYTSLAGLPYLLDLALPRHPGHSLADPTLGKKERVLKLRGLAQDGDALALELFDLQAKAMGLLVAQLTMTLDPSCFVIGGGLIDPEATTETFRDRYLGLIKSTALEYVWPTQKDVLRIIPASLGEQSQAIGAALVARLVVQSSPN